MAGMSSLVRIVNAGVPGSQDRVDVVLRDGVVASVGPAGTVSALDSTMQTKAHTTSLEYATNAIGFWQRLNPNVGRRTRRRNHHRRRRPVGYSRPVGLPHALHAMG